MKRRLPPFPAVRAFEAAARHCSMQRAAEELSLSPSAISHQVKALENYVGGALFERSPARLTLTETGADYLADLTRSLELMEAATVRASRHGETNHVVVYMFHSLSELWFAPLLKDLRRLHPTMRISIVCDPAVEDFSKGVADVALVYRPVRPGRREEFLFLDELTPCCSADYLKSEAAIATPQDLLSHPLIRCASDPDEWPIWMRHSGLGDREPRGWLEFDLRAAALQAAREGLGIAMGRRPYSDIAIKRRNLVQPLPITAPTGCGYYLAVPERTRHLKKVKIFSSWIRDVCSAMVHASANTGTIGTG